MYRYIHTPGTDGSTDWSVDSNWCGNSLTGCQIPFCPIVMTSSMNQPVPVTII